MMLTGCDILKTLPHENNIPVTEAEAGKGLKEALNQGLEKAVQQLNRQDGFFGNEFYKILLPPDAKKIENTLRDIGFSNLVDKAILQINRGAEDAVGHATPIFVRSIRQMTLNDAIGIVKGGDTSITSYFRGKTSQELMNVFLPIIKGSLDKTDATKYYGDIVNKYNGLPTTFKKINPDLPGFVTERATVALFDLISKEEKNIRQNPVARTTEILKKVFGNL